MYGKRINTINLCADGLMEGLHRPAGKWLDPPENVAEADERLATYVKAFADTGAIDVMLLNVNYHVSSIPSKVWDTAWQRLDGTPVTCEQLDAIRHWNKSYVQAHERGIEPYGMTIKHCRKNGISPWFSVRMNEFHYLRWPETSATLWLEHPEYRQEENKPFDYKHPEVRQYYIDYVTELCKNWDIDGIELDMIRYFESGATDEDRAAVTDCVRRIREMMQAVNKRRGRDMKLSARVYSLPETAHDQWCDAVKWIQEGLMDGLTLANFNMPCDYDIPFAQWRKEIGFEDGYFLQAGTDGGNFCAHWNNPYTRAVRMDTPMMRGLAESAWGNGADGMYVFNLNFPDSFDFTCLRDRDAACAGERRHLVPCHSGGQQDGWEMILSEEWQSVQLSVGRPGKHAFVRIGVVEEPGQIDVRVDGHDCVNLGVIQPQPGEEYDFNPQHKYGFRKLTQSAPFMLEFDCGSYSPSGKTIIEIRGTKTVEAIWAEICFKP